MADWDLVSQTPMQAASSSPTTVPFQPRVGQKNALMPGGMRVLATVPAKPIAGKITYRAPTDDELQQFPGIAQMGSNGKAVYGPRTGASSGKLSNQDAAYLSKARTSAGELSNLASQMGRFSKLNESVDTGGLMAMPGVNEMATPFDAKRATMNSIVSNITPAMRNGLPGAASDRDVAMFKEATVGLDKPLAANQAIAAAGKAIATRHNDYVAYMEAYAKKNGNLLGAQEGWNTYTDKNPLYGDDLNEHGIPVVKKVTPWRQVFPELKPAQASAPVAAKPDPLGLR